MAKNKIVEVEVNHTIDQMIAFQKNMDKIYEDAKRNVCSGIGSSFNL